MDSLKFKKYKLAGLVCKIVFTDLKHKILNDNYHDVLSICKLGNKLLLEKCNELSKKYLLETFINDVKIAFPTSISLNNCVGNYIYEKEGGPDFNLIKPNDLVKIELGLNIDNCINIFGESFVYTDHHHDYHHDHHHDHHHDKLLKVLDKLESKITKMANVETTNDDIKILVESFCTEYDCFPVENTYSYQHTLDHLQTDESKYIVTNHQKYYDEDDNLVGGEDICFDLEENDVFTINLSIIPNGNEENEKEHVYIEKYQPHLYKYNEYYHNFKLQSSKQFYSYIKKTHGNNVFSMIDYKDNVKYRMGLKESLENGVLNTYPVLFNKEKLPVYFKKFTLIVGKEKGINLSKITENEFNLNN